MIDALLHAGMDVARLNFSHGTPEEKTRLINYVRRASARYSKPVAIIADLQGPKIRTGALQQGKPVHLHFGQRFVISTKKVIGTEQGVSTTFLALPESVRKGDRILLNDGEISLRVLSTRGREVVCQVENGGELGENKGINLPGVKLKIPSLTPKDRRDLHFSLQMGANYVAQSFVRTAADVRAAKAAIARAGKDTPIIAKLEKPEAIDNLEEILEIADGVMVARGDLGVEMSLGKSSRCPKTDYFQRARCFGSRNYRHANAGFDAEKSAAHARGSFRRGQCNFRWQRCLDAFRRDRRGKLSAGIGGNDGPHYSRGGSERHVFTPPCAPPVTC